LHERSQTGARQFSRAEEDYSKRCRNHSELYDRRAKLQ
jgi:hypothetical protein